MPSLHSAHRRAGWSRGTSGHSAPTRRLAGQAILAGLACVVPVASGCGAEGPGSDGGSVPPQEVDVLVENGSPLWQGAEGWTVASDPTLELGALEGPAETQFQHITAAVRQSDGDLVVADGGAATVRIFSADGTPKALLGGRGPAPGEFRDPTHLRLGEDDAIWVWDQADWRLSHFDADGALLEVVTLRLEPLLQATAAPLYPASAMPLDPQRIVVRLLDKGSGKEAEPRGLNRPASGIMRVSIGGEIEDTVALFPDAESYGVDSPWGPWPVLPPLARTTLVTTHPTGARICWGDQALEEVLCTGDDATVMAIRWKGEPLLVDMAAVDAWRSETVEGLGQKISPDDARRLLAEVPEPDSPPQFRSLSLDPTGHLAVHRGATASTPRGYSELLVFDAEGTLLGPVDIPDVRILDIGAHHLLGVRTDELGVQFLSLYALQRD